MRQYETIHVESKKSTLKISLNRPNKANALNDQMFSELNEVISDVRNNPACKFVIFTGNGRHFSGGADMKEFMSKIGNTSLNSSWVRSNQVAMQEFHKKLETLDQVTIAVVNGPMYGGGLALALCCDFRFIARGATSCVPEVDRGMFFAAGSTPRLVNLVGSSKAKELIMFAKVINADEALNIGLANEIVADHDLFSKVDEMIEKLDHKPFLPIRLTKKIVNSSTILSDSSSIWEPELFEQSLKDGAIEKGVENFVKKKGNN